MAIAVPVPTSADTTSGESALEPLIAHARELLPVDGVAILGVDEARTRVEPLAGWYRHPDLEAVVEPAHRRPYDRRRPGLPEIVIERGRSLLLPHFEAWEAAPILAQRAREQLGDEAGERLWELYRSASLACVPITARHGRASGVIMVASLDPARQLTRQDLRLTQLLAESAALLLERSNVTAVETRRAREEQMLKHAAEDVSASLELDVVLERVAEHARRLSGATHAVVMRPGDEPGTEGHSGASALSLPLELGPRRLGSLEVLHPEPGRFTEHEHALLTQLARVSAAAMANSAQFQHERTLAGALSQGFVPQLLPEVPGFEVGLAYEPAASHPVGGDVYGLWPLPGGEVAMLVGDVAGKGVERAGLSAMVRFFLEARAWDVTDPGEVLEQANIMLCGRLPADTFVTAFLAFLSPGGLRYASAGHLPPLHLAGGGSSQLEEHGLPLGVEESCEARTSHVTLGPGDLVFAYSDGLLEARRDGELLGLERLRQTVEAQAARAAAADLPRAVHDEVSAWAGGLDDDAVALALRRTPS